MYIYSEVPKWVGAFIKYFTTLIYSMSYKGIFFGICRRFFWRSADLTTFEKLSNQKSVINRIYLNDFLNNDFIIKLEFYKIHGWTGFPNCTIENGIVFPGRKLLVQ